MPQLWVALSSDTEDNHPSYIPGWNRMGSNYDVNPAALRWNWSQYWRDLSESFEKYDVPVTWLIRVDDGPVRDRMLVLFRNDMKQLKAEGDEIGIHIHTWTWDPKLSRWAQTTDPKDETKIVHRSIDAFEKELGFSPFSVRMGFNAMSNEIMRTLDARGLLVDSSAVPNTFCPGKFGRRDNIMDWSRAPRIPYHPNYNDYQSPGDMKILEVPISTPEAKKPSVFAHLVNRLSDIRSSGSLIRLLPVAQWFNANPNSGFYISPWWSLARLVKIIRGCCKEARRNGEAFLVGYFHACDILDPRSGGKNLVFERYISRILEEISSIKDIHITFTTLSEIARNYKMN